ncbi:MAG: energy transducer TonB [Acidobacteria bacterium]|nr:energy transducer TonB [Acidobacteriota bacterium]
MNAAPLCRAFLFLVAGLTGASAAPAQPPAVPEPLLSGPLDAGTVARFVDFAADARVQARLGQAVADANPAVRAAAARIVHVTASTSALAAVADALSRETVVDAALEQTRALAALDGATHEQAIVTAWPRLGVEAWRVAAVHLAIRGRAAFGTIGALRAVESSPMALASVIRAARPDSDALGTLVETALADDDAVLLQAIVSVSTTTNTPIPMTRVTAMAAEDRPARMRQLAAEYVLRRQPANQPWTPEATAVLTSVTRVDGTGDQFHVVRELARRAIGQPPATDAAWMSLFDKPMPWTIVVSAAGAAALLTDSEVSRLRRVLPRFRIGGEEPTGSPNVLVQAMDSYPRGYVEAVLAATGCDLRRARTQGFGGGVGMLTLAMDGRATRLNMVDTGSIDLRCAEALRLLLTTHVAHPPTDVTLPHAIVVPFDADYIKCRDAQAFGPAAPTPDDSGRLQVPRKVRHREPTFPVAAARDRAGGVVTIAATIGTSGCLEDVRLVDTLDPRLDLAALRAVLDWRFEPARVDGRAVPMRTTVTVGFNVRRP